MQSELIVLFPLFIFSVVFHEYAHGLIAEKCGDNTARMMGRVTLNPLKHIDILGTIIVPLLLILSGMKFIIAWAKPVIINPSKFRNYRIDNIKVSLAGIGANFMLVCFTLLFMFILKVFGLQIPSLIDICKSSVYINVMLIIFNMLPIQPLDGSKILYDMVPSSVKRIMDKIEPYSFLILLVLINISIFRNVFGFMIVFISENLLRLVA